MQARGRNSSSQEENIKLLARFKQFKEKSKTFFREKSGGKSTVALKKIALPAAVGFVAIAILIAYLSKPEQRANYRHITAAQKPATPAAGTAQQSPPLSPMAGLFDGGKRQQAADKQKEAQAKRKIFAIKYFSPQILGASTKGPKVMKTGAKLIAVLKSPVDTRAPSLVRARIPIGGEQSGITIENDSILVGHYTYSGSGGKVYFAFTRIDSPDGDSRKIAATALDAADYTPGVIGDEYTGNGEKVAIGIGLTMFSAMADTLTDREQIGTSVIGTQANPTMKNALLQGTAKATQDQATRVESAIGQPKPYVIIPEGTEMIIELSEDFK